MESGNNHYKTISIVHHGIDAKIFLLSHGPAKVGSSQVSYPGLTPVSVHMAAIIIASAGMLRKYLRWRTKFHHLVFRCSDSAVAAQKARSTEMGSTTQENTKYIVPSLVS